MHNLANFHFNVIDHFVWYLLYSWFLYIYFNLYFSKYNLIIMLVSLLAILEWT